MRIASVLAQRLIVVVALAACVGANAQEATPGLYDRPVLALDPGMHTAPIWRADVDRAGRIAVTGSHDKTVRLWRLEDPDGGEAGSLIRTIRMPTGPGNVGKIYAVAISPDGGTVAAGGWTRWTPDDPQQQIYLFDAKTGQMTDRIDGLPNVVLDLAFSADGTRLAAALGGANGVRLYRRSPNGWVEAARDTDYGDSSYGVAFAPDGRFATTSYDGMVRLYDAEGTLTHTAESGFARPFTLAFNPQDGRLAVGFTDSTAVRLFDGRTLAPLPAPDTDGIDNGDLSKVAWSADGETLYAAGLYYEGGERPVMAWGHGAARTRLPGSLNTVMSLRPLPDGALLVASADPYLGVVAADGTRRWTNRPVQMDPRGQRSTFSVSPDGMTVDFGFEVWGERRARFDVAALALSLAPPDDGRTRPPEHDALAVADWEDSARPTLNGAPLQLERFETSRSLAIHPDGARFVLGAEWSLRAFDDAGTELWQRAVPGVVWAVNIAAERELVVAAYNDGTIRWHRLDNGAELLAVFPFNNGEDWIAWEPEGRFAGTLGATKALRWISNRGYGQTPQEIRAGQIRKSYRPGVIKRILPTGSTMAAIHADENASRAEDFRESFDGTVPGAQLHVLTIGVGAFGNAATHQRLSLKYAAKDAEDLYKTFAGQIDHPYQQGFASNLTDADAKRDAITFELSSLMAKMARSDGRDLAVITFSGHGVVLGEGPLREFYLLPHDTDDRRPLAIRNTALSGTTLANYIQAIASYGRVLVLIDACSSGAAMSSGVTAGIPDADIRRLVAGNVTVFASSAATEVSREADGWENGAFTETVLEALGHADRIDGNGFVSVGELQDYVHRELPLLTDRRQTPTIETRFGGDLFALGS